MTLHFVVYGIAQQQGSIRAFVAKRTGRPILTSDNSRLGGWRHLVAAGASAALSAKPAAERRPCEGAARLAVDFHLPRPHKIPKARKGRHVTSPDLDKLVRAIGDALNGLAWHDDRQVVELVARKAYTGPTEPPHVEIWIDDARAVDVEAAAS